MDTMPFQDGGRPDHPSETEAERQVRLATKADARTSAEHIRRLTLEGLADVDAGRLIDDDAMRAWADSLGTGRELPIPQPG